MKLAFQLRLAVLAVTASGLIPNLTAADAPEFKFAQPSRGPIVRYVTLPGTLKANQQTTLYAKVPGYLKAISVDIGDVVKSGQVIAEIEVPELQAELGKAKATIARAKAEVTRAKAEMGKVKAELEAAETELSRLTRARKSSPDLVVPQRIDDATARREAAKASQAQAKASADLASARQRETEADLERIETLLAFAKVRAPFAGVISARHVDPGAFIPSATSGSAARTAAVVTVVEYDTIRAEVAVPEIEAARVVPGQPVKVIVEGLGKRMFEAKVSRHAQALDESSRSLNVETDIANPKHELRPGMFATLMVGVEQHDDVLRVPASGVLTEKSGASVFLLLDGKAKKTPVKTGFNDGKLVEITNGLSGGEKVLLFDKTAPADGATVKATEAR